MKEELFDLTEHYQAMLMQGIRLSGEEQEFFIAGRVAELRRRLPKEWAPHRVLDFGCGLGHAVPYLRTAFPESCVVGADTSDPALEEAAREYGSAWVSFHSVSELNRETGFDLCYVNGVFHHIPPPERLEVVRLIFDCLRPGGYLALFENNPWNPGARMVMARIPFDREAVMMSPSETEKLIRAAGFQPLRPTRSLFYFPRALRWLRPSEQYLGSLPLGAQYYVLGRKA